MLPFLKYRDDGVGQGPVETVERKPDEDKELDMLDAVASDFLQAFEKKDKKLLKEALSAFRDHILEEDKEQDQSMIGELK